MAVNIDPSEVRNGASFTQPRQTQCFRLPLRAVLVGGLGGAGLIAFSVGAFSFFSTLADPRARLPRTAPAAASMPDLKDGMPALITGEPMGDAPKTATLNLPRPNVSEPAPAAPPVFENTAALPAVAEPTPSKIVANEPEALPFRAGARLPPIENAATLLETRTVALVAPTRQAATIAPARVETVKAKPVQPGSVASLPAVSAPEHRPEPTSTATAVSPPTAVSARKAVAAKPPAQKTAARKVTSASTVADAEPAVAPAAAAGAASEDSDIPGARQFRAGIKAIGGIFGGDAKDE